MIKQEIERVIQVSQSEAYLILLTNYGNLYVTQSNPKYEHLEWVPVNLPPEIASGNAPPRVNLKNIVRGGSAQQL